MEREWAIRPGALEPRLMPDAKLSLLGGLDIAGDASDGRSLTRKARGMLAYLALHPRQPQSREKLAAMFWGGTAETQARTNLRQTLSSLRKALTSLDGAHLRTEGDHVALDLNGLALDVLRFEELVARSTPEDLEQAIALYRGDLLDGFSLNEEPFEEWTRSERERLRAMAVAALERLVTHYVEIQDFGRCVPPATRLLALDPLREDIHRALMRAYAAQGRVNLALKQYDICRNALRRELGVQPEPDTERLYTRIRKQRAALVPVDAPQSRSDAGVAADPSAPREPLNAGRSAPSPAVPQGLTLLVRPFGSSSHGGDELAVGLTEGIRTALSKLRWLSIMPPSPAPGTTGDASDIQTIANQNGARFVLEGSVRRNGGRVRVAVRLVDARNASHLWAERYDRQLTDLFTIEDELVRCITATIEHVLVAARIQPRDRDPMREGDIRSALQTANWLMRRLDREDNMRAVRLLQQVIAANPDCVAAHQILSFCHTLNAEFGWSIDLADEAGEAVRVGKAAVALADHDYLSHCCLAEAALFARDFEQAVAAAQRALALNPNSSVAMGISGMVHAFAGSADEALALLETVLRIDPDDPCLCEYKWAYAVAQFALGNQPEAVAWAAAGSVSKPDIVTGHLIQAAARGLAGDVDVARAELNEARRCAPDLSLTCLRTLLPLHCEDDHARLLHGLRLAGFAHVPTLRTPPIDGLPLPGRPSVAVLPFDNDSGDADQTYFANGIAESIITGLTRFHPLFVMSFTSSRLARERSADVQEIGRRLGVAHVVEGSVRRSGSRVRVTAQLVDAADGHRVWAERYDRTLDDVFAVQDEITDVIVATLAGRIEDANRRRSAHKPATDLATYDYLLRARECLRRYTQRDELAARSYLQRAIELDPNYAPAYAALALSYIHEYESPWSQDPQSAIDRAFELGQKAVALDETESIAHKALAYAAHYRDEVNLAKKEIERAVVLNPNDYSNLCIRAWILNFSGCPEQALICRDQTLRLNPLAPDSCLLDIGVAYYTMREYGLSAETFSQMSSWNLLRHACLAACRAQLGQDAEALAAAARALDSMRTEFTGETAEIFQRWLAYVRRMFRFRKPDDWEHLVEGFRKAGIPI
jgi:TolB-like protein/DNA-binding SARP family transcriptional activator/Flp pilus assembly protein TadD